MSSTVIIGIGELLCCDDSTDDRLGRRQDQALVVSDGMISWIGPPSKAPAADHRIDLDGATLLPGFVDSHSHLVFAGDRSDEFAARMTGERYDGGGIVRTVEATRASPDDDLARSLRRRIAELRSQGTTTVEIKSGYGLSVEQELRCVRLAAQVTSETTLLGAHVVPPEWRDDRAGYVELVRGPMITAVGGAARWIDVFCEPHSPYAFTGEESEAILRAGREAGLGLRVHGNQLGEGPGVRLAVELGAASVDHCTFLSGADVDALAGAASGPTPTVATLLPAVEFCTRSPYPDARRLIEAGVPLALATDCNPGTCASSSMPFVIALAVRELGLTVAEAVFAATAGGAQALRRDDLGTIAVGRRADLAVLAAPSYLHLAYRPGVPLTRALDLPD